MHPLVQREREREKHPLVQRERYTITYSMVSPLLQHHITHERFILAREKLLWQHFLYKILSMSSFVVTQAYYV